MPTGRELIGPAAVWGRQNNFGRELVLPGTFLRTANCAARGYLKFRPAQFGAIHAPQTYFNM